LRMLLHFMVFILSMFYERKIFEGFIPVNNVLN
jgi:hypothetical protein